MKGVEGFNEKRIHRMIDNQDFNELVRMIGGSFIVIGEEYEDMKKRIDMLENELKTMKDLR